MCLKDGEPIKGSAVTMMNNSCPCKEAEEGKAVSEMVAGTDKHGGDMHKDNEKPPNPLGSAIRQSVNNGRLASPCPVSLVRHNSLMKSTAEAVGAIKNKESVDFMPILRSGYWSDIGGRLYMEDAHVCITDLAKTFGCASFGESPVAFYGVFDGHGGKAAAHFVRDNLPRLIVESADFPLELEKAVRWSFLETDNAFAEACLLQTGLSSGTTALTAMISGRSVLNAFWSMANLCGFGCCLQHRISLDRLWVLWRVVEEICNVWHFTFIVRHKRLLLPHWCIILPHERFCT